MTGWILTIPATNGELLVYPLDQTITIGRAPDNRIQLPGTSVSRYHAVLEPGEGGYTVRDLGSTNGTMVNQALVKRPKRLREGDVLRVGNYQLTVGRQQAIQGPGGTFVQSPAVQAPPAAPPKKRRSFWRTCLVITLLSLCGLLVVGAGGYYLYTSGTVSRRTVLNAVGLGAGEIGITNVTEAALTAQLTRLDTDSGSPETFNDVRIEPLDIAGIGGIPPGRYLLDFSGGKQASCSMQIESGDQFNLLAVPEGIAITKVGYEPDSADELDLATSSLCRR